MNSTSPNAWFTTGITVSSLMDTCHRCVWVWFPAGKVWKLKAIDAGCRFHGNGTGSSWASG